MWAVAAVARLRPRWRPPTRASRRGQCARPEYAPASPGGTTGRFQWRCGNTDRVSPSAKRRADGEAWAAPLLGLSHLDRLAWSDRERGDGRLGVSPVSYTHLRAHET